MEDQKNPGPNVAETYVVKTNVIVTLTLKKPKFPRPTGDPQMDPEHSVQEKKLL